MSAPPPPRLVVGILTFNRIDRLLRTLDLIAAHDYDPDRIEVVLLDNASTDGTSERVAERFGASVSVIRSDWNRGPVFRNALLLSRRGDYVVIFDDDCVPASPTTLRQAVRILEERPHFDALCFRSRNVATGKFEFGHPGGIGQEYFDDGSVEGMYVVGGGMLFRSSDITGIEGYDERMTFGGEEYDLALELLRSEIRILWHPEVVIDHHEEPRAESSIRGTELDMRNNIRIAVRRFPAILVPFVLAAHILRRLLAASIRRDSVRLRGYLRGVRSGFSGIGRFVRTRRPVSVGQLFEHRRWTLGMFAAAIASRPPRRRK